MHVNGNSDVTLQFFAAFLQMEEKSKHYGAVHVVSR
jgi:hypothetical protein